MISAPSPTEFGHPAAENGALLHRGFQRAGDLWCRNGIRLRQEGRWAVLESDAGADADHEVVAQIGQPGLWRVIADLNGDPRRVFELHDSVLSLVGDASSPDTNSEPRSMLDDCLDWALGTADGKIPVGWQPPARAEIEALIPRGRLTIASGTEARQGELIHAPGRLALRFPILHRVPAGLPELRRRWLRDILFDAQNRWRLVRLGFTGQPDNLAIAAEVDLSGAPHAALEPLLSVGLDSLHWVVTWLVETAALLADADVACRALEFGPCPQPNPGKE